MNRVDVTCRTNSAGMFSCENQRGRNENFRSRQEKILRDCIGVVTVEEGVENGVEERESRNEMILWYKKRILIFCRAFVSINPHFSIRKNIFNPFFFSALTVGRKRRRRLTAGDLGGMMTAKIDRRTFWIDVKIETVRHVFNYASQLIRVMIKKWTRFVALSGLKFYLF